MADQSSQVKFMGRSASSCMPVSNFHLRDVVMAYLGLRRQSKMYLEWQARIENCISDFSADSVEWRGVVHIMLRG